MLFHFEESSTYFNFWYFIKQSNAGNYQFGKNKNGINAFMQSYDVVH